MYICNATIFDILRGKDTVCIQNRDFLFHSSKLRQVTHFFFLSSRRDALKYTPTFQSVEQIGQKRVIPDVIDETDC